MENKKALMEVYDDIMNDQMYKLDFETDDISIDSKDGSILVDKIPMKINNWATSQLFQKMDMPTKYFSELLERDPELTSYHFNKVFKNEPKRMLIRTHSFSNDKPCIRGVLSDLYSVLDNITVANSLLQILPQFSTEVKLESSYIEDRYLHLRILFPTTQRELGLTTRKVGDIVQAGVDIVNSEVGFSSLNIAALVWRLVCTNGMRSVTEESYFSQRHIHVESDIFTKNMSFAIYSGIKGAIKTIDSFSALKEIDVPYALEAIPVVGERLDIPKYIVKDAQEEWQTEEDSTAYGIVNSFTAAAKRLSNDARLEMEKTAFIILCLSIKEWARINRIAEQNNAEGE
jgi:hypothetical protein